MQVGPYTFEVTGTREETDSTTPNAADDEGTHPPAVPSNPQSLPNADFATSRGLELAREGVLGQLAGRALATSTAWLMRNSGAILASYKLLVPREAYTIAGVEVDIGQKGRASVRAEKALLFGVENKEGKPVLGLSTLSGEGFGWESEKFGLESSSMSLNETLVWSSSPVSERSASLSVKEVSKESVGAGMWWDNRAHVGAYGYYTLEPAFLGAGLGWSRENVVEANAAFQNHLNLIWFMNAPVW
jgi:hypothetical protein